MQDIIESILFPWVCKINMLRLTVSMRVGILFEHKTVRVKNRKTSMPNVFNWSPADEDNAMPWQMDRYGCMEQQIAYYSLSR